jgi:glycosyltransferase involved in cell wall biosynthesis
VEGLGTAVLEAMPAGLPVIAFDIPPIREVSEDGRALVRADGRRPSVADGIVAALRGGLADVAQAGFDHVTDFADLYRVSENVELLLRDACGGDASHHRAFYGRTRSPLRVALRTFGP